MDEPLTDRQEAALDLVLAGVPGKTIAKRLECSEFTVSRWRNSTAFQAALRQRRRDLRARVLMKLETLVSKALDVLDEELDADDSHVRLRSAEAVIKTLKVCEPTQAEDQFAGWSAEKLRAELQRVRAQVAAAGAVDADFQSVSTH